jgi:hypothetical protein
MDSKARETGPPHRSFRKLPSPGLQVYALPALRVSPGELCPAVDPSDAPDPDTEKGFDEVRASVAAAKGALDKIPREDFQPLMNALSLYGGLRYRLRVECNMQVATNASLKLYEILTYLRFGRDDELAPEPAGRSSPEPPVSRASGPAPHAPQPTDPPASEPEGSASGRAAGPRASKPADSASGPAEPRAPKPADSASGPAEPRAPEPAGAAPRRGARLRAFCNAELPGAFVATLNHYARTMCPHAAFDWLASSYYPPEARQGGVEALGDQYGLYAGNRERWLMGPRPNGLPPGAPESGDLLDAQVVPALADAVLARWPAGATLYTSDAGIDVSRDFNSQEEATALLNFGQVVCGLLALARGDTLVTKQFAFTRPFSRSLIALVAAVFDAACLVKPRASAGGNSEVYLVGRGFRGLAPGLGARLLARLAGYRRDPAAPCAGPPLVAPGPALQLDRALLRAAQALARQQAAFLSEAAQAHAAFRGRLGELRRAAGPAAFAAQQAWLAENPVRRLRPEQWLSAAREGPAGRPGPPRAAHGKDGAPGRERPKHRPGRSGPPF